MASLVEDIAVRIGLDPKQFSAGTRQVLKDLKSIKAAFATMGDGFSKVGDGLQTFSKTATVFVGTLTAAAAAVFALTEASANSADQAKATAAALGLTIEQYGRLAFAAKASNLAAEDFASGYAKFNKLVVQAQRGDQTAIDTFRRMGIRIKDTDGNFRDFNITLFDAKGKALQSVKVLEQVAETFRLVKDGSDKSERAISAFGKSGTQFIPFLKEGRAGIRKLGDEAERLGIVFTKAQGDIGDDFGDAADRSKASLIGLRNQIGLTIAPDITKLFDLFTAAVVRNRQAIVDLAVRGYLFAKQTVLDFINAFQGNDKDVKQQWVLDARDNILAFGVAVEHVWKDVLIPFAADVTKILDTVAQANNGVFGTNLDGKDVAIIALVARVTGLFAIFSGGITVILGLGRAIVGVVGLVAGLVTAIGAIPTAILIGIPLAIAGLVIYWDDIKKGFTAVYDYVADLFAHLGTGIKRALGIAVAATPGQSLEKGSLDLSAPVSRAGGGLVRGPGTGTSDSIHTDLSDKEYVVRAASVKKFGTGVMDAINSGRWPGFAEGGLVQAAGTPINLHMPDGATFPLQAGASVAESLTRYARGASRYTPGKNPSWKR